MSSQRGLDVGEAAEAPEVEPLVVVERRLVPKALVGRVRVGVDLDVVGVVVQVAHVPSSVDMLVRAYSTCCTVVQARRRHRRLQGAVT